MAYGDDDNKKFSIRCSRSTVGDCYSNADNASKAISSSCFVFSGPKEKRRVPSDMFQGFYGHLAQ